MPGLRLGRRQVAFLRDHSNCGEELLVESKERRSGFVLEPP